MTRCCRLSMRLLFAKKNIPAARQPHLAAAGARIATLVFVATMFVGTSPAAEPAQQLRTLLKDEDFSLDPNWDGFRNRLLPEKLPVVRQQFGYAKTNHAGGKGVGEIGGTVQRSFRRAYYAKAIDEKNLSQRLSASGRLAVTHAEGGSGILFGWFNETSDGWRTPNSIGLRIDSNGGRYLMFYEYGTRNWKTGGGGAFEGERWQTTPTKPFAADGTANHWSLDYDPRAENEPGQLTFAIDERTYSIPVPVEHKNEGAVFNRFGLWNVQLAGAPLDVYFDDLVIDGQHENFDADPGWVGADNKIEFTEPIVRPYHNFGHSPTANAGGEAGEIGGVIFRDEAPAYYGADVGSLSLDVPLVASGKIVFCRAGSDSGVYLGWFNAQAKQNKQTPDYEKPQTDYLGILIEGPSSVGHYFRPCYATAAGKGDAPMEDPPTGKPRPLIKPDRQLHTWTLAYDPQQDRERGRITLSLDGEKHSLTLKEGERGQGARFDRFGLFNLQAGGHHVEIYLDDIQYTAARPAGR